MRKTTRLATQRPSRQVAGEGHDLGVDVEDLRAVRAEDDAGDDRDQAVVEERNRSGVVSTCSACPTSPISGDDRSGGGPRTRPPSTPLMPTAGDAGGVELESHKLLVDGTGKHHDGQLQGLVVGDAQAVDERGLFVHARQPVGERGAAAVGR